MKISEKGINFIKNFEGLRLKAYKCSANKLTIGYGHTNNVRADDVITREEAEQLIRIDISSREKNVNRLVKVPLTQSQFDALVSFEFNCGGLTGSTLLKKLNLKDYKGAAAQFLVWNKITVKGKLQSCQGLTNRRVKEKELFLS